MACGELAARDLGGGRGGGLGDRCVASALTKERRTRRQWGWGGSPGGGVAVAAGGLDAVVPVLVTNEVEERIGVSGLEV